MSRVEWTEPAVHDLNSIKRYYETVNGGFAERAADAAAAAGRWLLDFPNAGTLVGGGGLRKWRVRNTPLLLLYRPSKDGLLVLRIRHERERW